MVPSNNTPKQQLTHDTRGTFLMPSLTDDEDDDEERSDTYLCVGAELLVSGCCGTYLRRQDQLLQLRERRPVQRLAVAAETGGGVALLARFPSRGLAGRTQLRLEGARGTF